jgi:hypothetical protein
LSIDITDLVASVGIAPKLGQVPTAPRCAAGWSKPPVGDSEDLQRVLALPRRPQPTKDEERAVIEYMTNLLRRDRAGSCKCRSIRRNVEDPCLTTLRAAQSWALLEIATTGGLLGSIGVGHGKTLLGILTPMVVPDCKLALLLVPPTLVSQLITEYELAAEHFKVPSLVVHGREWSRIIPDRPILHVMPYSRLSRKNATSFIARLNPDTIISDEVHKLQNAQTATTSRVLRHFASAPHTKFAGWTGSLTDKSLTDYGHLAALALRFGSPLPLDPHVLSEWARAIDPSPFPSPAGALFGMCEPGESIESGYHRRLTETQGVVATKSSAIDAHLIVTQRKSPPVPHIIKEAMQGVRDTWLRPDGEELVEAFEVARSCRELACGFYYRWIYPRGESEETIARWFTARKAWNRELRGKLQAREEHLDSPLLCREAAIRAWSGDDSSGLPLWKAQTWPEWNKVKDTVKPKTKAVWLDDYLAQDAADWGLSHRGVVWYSYATFGARIGALSGLPVHTGGPKAAEIIAREDGSRSIIASIKAHGTGRDGLQRLFKTQLVTNPPSSATAWEQLLGRLHRIGQKADTVTAEVYRHTQEFRNSVDQAMARALYVQETLGSEQKLRTGYALE